MGTKRKPDGPARLSGRDVRLTFEMLKTLGDAARVNGARSVKVHGTRERVEMTICPDYGPTRVLTVRPNQKDVRGRIVELRFHLSYVDMIRLDYMPRLLDLSTDLR